MMADFGYMSKIHDLYMHECIIITHKIDALYIHGRMIKQHMIGLEFTRPQVEKVVHEGVLPCRFGVLTFYGL